MLKPDDSDFATWCQKNKGESQLLMVLRNKPGITAAQWWDETTRSDWMLWLMEATQVFFTPTQKIRFDVEVRPVWEAFERNCRLVDKNAEELATPFIEKRRRIVDPALNQLVEAPDELRYELVPFFYTSVQEAWKVFEIETQIIYMDAKITKAKLRAPCRVKEAEAIRSLIGNPYK